uniref:J domain-containing protein n=1 Tax=Aureoumbra lagunensis TaxID=44058 RepID=A0A7S3K316_9STRA
MTLLLLRSKDDAKTSVLKVTIPESWESKPCRKLLNVWRKHKKEDAKKSICLCASDGTIIPEEWSVEAVVAVYQGELWVRSVHNDAEEALALANEAYSAGEYAVAVQKYSEALREKQWLGRTQTLANMAAAKMMLGEYASALVDCESALSDQSCETILKDRLLVRTARCRLQLGDAAGAEDIFVKVLNQGATAMGDASDTAVALASEAIEGQERARALGKALRSARKMLSSALENDTQTFSICLERASEAMKLAPLSTEAAGLKCRALCGLRLWPAAAGFHKQYCEQIENYHGTALDRGLSQDVLRAYSYAAPESVALLLRRWIEQRPRSSHWIQEAEAKQSQLLQLKTSGDTATKSKQFAAAEQMYRSALDLDPEHPTIRANLAAILQASGRYNEAANHCRKAISFQPVYPRLRLRLARCLIGMGQIEQALDAYQAYFNDCKASETQIDPAATLEYSNLYETATEKHQKQDNWSEDEQRSFYENYRIYAQRFAKNRPPSWDQKKEDTSTSHYDQNTPSSRTAALKVLGISENFSLTELKRRYRELILLYHPDKSSEPDSDVKFRQIRSAYQYLIQ